MTAHDSECVFCQIRSNKILRTSETCITVFDEFPVSSSHVLIIPKRHTETYYDLNADELRDVQFHLEEERSLILKTDPEVTGFNIGMNCGIDAGQTVMHCHIHLIPRRKNDMDDPRGGVRGVIPAKRIY